MGCSMIFQCLCGLMCIQKSVTNISSFGHYFRMGFLELLSSTRYYNMYQVIVNSCLFLLQYVGTYSFALVTEVCKQVSQRRVNNNLTYFILFVYGPFVPFSFPYWICRVFPFVDICQTHMVGMIAGQGKKYICTFPLKHVQYQPSFSICGAEDGCINE